MHSDVGR